MKKLTSTVYLLFCLSFICTELNAQKLLLNNAVDSTLIEQKSAVDLLGRNNPRESVNGFFKSLSNNNYLRASQYINLPNQIAESSDSLKITLVKKIEIALNKYGRMDPISILNNSTEGDNNDGLGERFERIGVFELDNKTIPFLLELVESPEEGSKLWLISIDTTSELIDYFNANTQDFELESPSKKTSYKWFKGISKDWLAMIVLAIASYLLAWLFTLLIGIVVRLFMKRFEQFKLVKFLRALLIPLRLILAVAIILNASRFFGISILVRQAFSVVNLIAVWSALFIFIWLLIDALSSFSEVRLRERNILSGLSAISFLKNSAKFTLIAVAILIIFETLGFNITAGIAALGVGGIALALGAQKTVENIVGGLSVLFDEPVNVGDFCKFGETIGTVENIGMRSTRIRTLGRTVVTIPNADFSSRSIENYSKRDLFWFHTTFGLRYETSSDQIRYVLRELRSILYAHPKVDPDPARVRFLGYGSHSLKIEISAYIHAEDWNGFLGIQEDINLRIAKVIEDSGSSFAFPSQTLYLSKDKDFSESKKKEVETQVQNWIENDQLGIPEFDEKTIEKLKNSLEYPTKPTNKTED